MIKKGDKNLIRGWVFYDWANSVYNLVVSSTIFPIFYNSITTSYYLKQKGWDELPDGETVWVEFFGQTLSSSVLFSYVLAASFLTVAILSPILSGVADYSGSKKRFMQFFCYFGSLSCMSLFFFTPAHMEWSMLSVYFASIGFWNSLVFYNAFLPEIANPDQHDRISARGFTMGYIGSMLLLVICLLLLKVPIITYFDDPNTEAFEGMPAKYCFVLVGLWWLSFSQITFRRLPNNVFDRKPEKGIISRGFKELLLVFKSFKQNIGLKRYLYSFFFFNTGVQTVMLLATVFANKEVDWPENDGASGLIIAILLIQILGAVGAQIMSRLSEKFGNISTLKWCVFVWILLCTATFFFVYKPIHFYILAACVGLVMGGVQALARSTYSKFLPETEDHASYFSFYDVSEKIGIVIGTFFFGFIEAITGSIRFSVISVTLFFILGFVLLQFVPKNLNQKNIEH